MRLVRDEENNPLEIIGYWIDVTERKRVEEALRESEENFRALAQNANDGILVLTDKGTYVYANQRAAEITGYSIAELLEVKMSDLAHPDEVEKLKDRLEKRLAGQPAPHQYEAVLIDKDGKTVPVEVTAARTTWHDQVADIVILRDITERKRTERLLQTLNQAATAMEKALTSEEIFTALAEELKKLGMACTLLLMDESQSRLFTRYMSFDAEAIKAAERLTRLRHKDFSFPIQDVDMYRETVRGRKTVFVSRDDSDMLQQMLPRPLKKLVGQLARILKIPSSITAPLIIEDQVVGIFSVHSDDLTPSDAPTITAFAHQVAAVWRKGQLFEQTGDRRAQAGRGGIAGKRGDGEGASECPH
jgi:PAS domain S-box-containing protein